jgi:hypothetical protein
MQIIHIEREKRYATCYYFKDGVIHSLCTSNQDWQNLFGVTGPDNETALEGCWLVMISKNPGSEDSGYIDLIIDKPELAQLFKPFMNNVEITVLHDALNISV